MKNITKGFLVVTKWMTIAINLTIVFLISVVTLPIAWMVNYDALALTVKKYAINLMVIPAFAFGLLTYRSNLENFGVAIMLLVPVLAMVNAMTFKEIK